MADPNWLVGFTNDTGPVPYYPYYLYDRATRRARFLFDHRPELSSYELAPMGPFSFAARDGSAIHGYATFPLGAEPPAGGAERARRPLGPGQLGLRPRGAVDRQPGFICAGNGAPRCMTTWWTRSATRSLRAGRARQKWRSREVLTEATRRSSVPPLLRAFFAALSTRRPKPIFSGRARPCRG